MRSRFYKVGLMIGGSCLEASKPWDFFVQEFRAKYVTDMYKEAKWKLKIQYD